MLSRRLTIDAQPRCEEGPAAPQHRRRGEHELHPYARRGPQQAPAPAKCVPIAKATSGTDSANADPKPPRHVAQLGIRPRRRRATSVRAPCRRSGSCPARRAGSPGASGRSTALPRRSGRRFGRGRGFEIARRVRLELLAAAAAAEIIGVAGMLGAMLGGDRIDRHAANRIPLCIGSGSPDCASGSPHARTARVWSCLCLCSGDNSRYICQASCGPAEAAAFRAPRGASRLSVGL